MPKDSRTYDYIIIGAGSAGCAVAAGLDKHEMGSVLVLEAGPKDSGPLVSVPFGLVWLMGGKRDWRFLSSPQKALGGRQLKIPRGKMLGGSSSINSMVWFRGRYDDFDGWNVPGWSGEDVWPEFDEVEAELQPSRLAAPHPLSKSFALTLGSNGIAPPTPEYESAGVFHVNMENGQRHSAADAFLRPTKFQNKVTVLTGSHVDKISFKQDQPRQVHLADGSVIIANKGVILSAGSVGSPEILLRSGIGPKDDLQNLGIDATQDEPEVGENLHDHPACGVHHQGPGSGYGLVPAQAMQWLLSPFQYLVSRSGPLSSNSVEAGAFFNAQNDGGIPDIQVHFIPFMMGWKGRTIVPGSGYFADVCVCRPLSRGRLRLSSANPNAVSNIDLGLFNNPKDMETLVAGFKRLRKILDDAPFGNHKAPEVFPAETVQSDEQISQHIIKRCGTAYHPVGTLRIGEDNAPVSNRLAVKGFKNFWVADASIMPKVTSANTNAPSMMIGHRAAKFIMEDAA